MRWPWSKPETRASYTDSIVSALLNAAAGTTFSASTTAALEAAAGAVGRGFAAAKISGAPPIIEAALAPRILEQIGRNLIRTGDSLHLLIVEGAELRLQEVGSWDIRGGPDPEQWWVRADIFGPSGNLTKFVPHSSTVHCRFSTDPARPWIGVGPIQWASSAGKLHAGVVNALTADTRAASGYAVPLPGGSEAPDDENDNPLAALKLALTSAKGKSVFVETTAGSFGGDTKDAPRGDWEQKRLGADPPDALAKLHETSATSLIAACGLDPAMLGFGRSDGTFAREAYRRFDRLTLRPLAKIVEAELRVKLGAPELTLGFDSLRASDFAGTARAYGLLTEHGLTKIEAANLLDMEIPAGEAA